MQKKEKYTPEGSNDMERLINAMNQLKDRNFKEIDDSVFENAEAADAYNEMLDSIMKYNNHYLMRINDAMIRIADNSRVKEMLTRIIARKDAIESLRETNESLSMRLQRNETQLIEALAMAKQIDNNLTPCSKEMTESEQLLEASISDIDNILGKKDISNQELIHACKDAKAKEKRALTILKYAAEAVHDIEEQAGIVRKNIVEICAGDNSQVDMFKKFSSDLQFLTDNYSKLLESCFNVGSQLCRISRDIDNARNDMFRHNSRPTMLDRLSVFYVDHLTLAWRLYLNIVEYENLKITQVNNPDRCKFGLWCADMTDPQIRDAEAFQNAFDTHQEFHKHAVACFLAKEASDIQEATEEFNNALKTCEKLQEALQQLSQHVRALGITEQTEVWKFQA